VLQLCAIAVLKVVVLSHRRHTGPLTIPLSSRICVLLDNRHCLQLTQQLEPPRRHLRVGTCSWHPQLQALESLCLARRASQAASACRAFHPPARPAQPERRASPARPAQRPRAPVQPSLLHCGRRAPHARQALEMRRCGYAQWLVSRATATASDVQGRCISLGVRQVQELEIHFRAIGPAGQVYSACSSALRALPDAGPAGATGFNSPTGATGASPTGEADTRCQASLALVRCARPSCLASLPRHV